MGLVGFMLGHSVFSFFIFFYPYYWFCIWIPFFVRSSLSSYHIKRICESVPITTFTMDKNIMVEREGGEAK